MLRRLRPTLRPPMVADSGALIGGLVLYLGTLGILLGVWWQERKEDR